MTVAARELRSLFIYPQLASANNQFFDISSLGLKARSQFELRFSDKEHDEVKHGICRSYSRICNGVRWILGRGREDACSFALCSTRIDDYFRRSNWWLHHCQPDEDYQNGFQDGN